MSVARISDMKLLHPRFIEPFMLLEYDLASTWRGGDTATWFRPFETYRHPMRQLEVLRNKTSRAGPYESPHQFGLAVDFVPWDNGRWSWDLKHDWEHLRRLARVRGLRCEIDWDRAHVEAPLWADMHAALKVM